MLYEKLKVFAPLFSYGKAPYAFALYGVNSMTRLHSVRQCPMKDVVLGCCLLEHSIAKYAQEDQGQQALNCFELIQHEGQL